jgi:hypothetical protein
MNEITRPTSCKWNDQQGAVTLYWKHQDKRNGEYHVRGGICWPVQDRASGTARGAVVICAEHLKTHVVTLVEEAEFLTIEPYTLDGVMHNGLSSFVNTAFSTYLVEMYYQHQPVDMCHSYSIQMYRSRQFGKTPHFVQVTWDNEDQADAVLPTLDGSGKFVFRKTGLFGKAMERKTAQPSAFLPEIHALTCAVNGLQRFPWRRIDIEEDE